MADTTSFLRITVFRYAAACSALRGLWSSAVLPRAQETDVLVLDLHNAHFDDLHVVPEIIRRCREDLPRTELRIAFDGPLELPGKLPDVIWEEIDLTPEDAVSGGQNDQFSGLRFTR